MSNAAWIIFPDQLVPIKKLRKNIIPGMHILLMEDPSHFADADKLVFHRASMRYYADELSKLYGMHFIQYLEYSVILQSSYTFVNRYRTVFMYNRGNCDLYRYCLTNDIRVNVIDSPCFMYNKLEDIIGLSDEPNKVVMYPDYAKTQKKKYIMPFNMFRDKMYKDIGILFNIDECMKGAARPDVIVNPQIPIHGDESTYYITEAKQYIIDNKLSSKKDSYIHAYPISSSTAVKWLSYYTKRMNKIKNPQSSIFVSIILLCIDVGLITPKMILEQCNKDSFIVFWLVKREYYHYLNHIANPCICNQLGKIVECNRALKIIRAVDAAFRIDAPFIVRTITQQNLYSSALLYFGAELQTIYRYASNEFVLLQLLTRYNSSVIGDLRYSICMYNHNDISISCLSVDFWTKWKTLYMAFLATHINVIYRLPQHIDMFIQYRRKAPWNRSNIKQSAEYIKCFEVSLIDDL